MSRRYSATLDIEMLYVAVPVRNETAPMISEVRLALPLTDIRDELAALRRTALVAAAAGLASALLLAWAASLFLSGRVADDRRSGRAAMPAATSRVRRGTTAPTKSARSRACSTSRSATSAAAPRSSPRIAPAWRPSSAGWPKASWSSTRRGTCSWPTAPRSGCCGCRTSPEGRHYLEIIRNPDIAAQISAALRGGQEGQSLELPLPHGVIVTVRSASVRAERATGAVVVLHDITELRRADRVRRDFVANVSHELRTPLTAVRGYVEALLDGGADAASSRRFLEIISRHTLRMERLVRDLLRLARLDAGQERREHVACTVSSLFGGVEADLIALMESRRVEVDQDIAADAQTVHGDPAALHDIFRNLLENAINYSPEDGTVVMGCRREGSRLLLTVADEGRGIPEADLPRIFERFYRVDKARSAASAIRAGPASAWRSSSISSNCTRGRVSAANRREGGAIFTVELPRADWQRSQCLAISYGAIVCATTQ